MCSVRSSAKTISTIMRGGAGWCAFLAGMVYTPRRLRASSARGAAARRRAGALRRRARGAAPRVRLKPPIFASKEDYSEALIAHHTLMQAAMKCKQTVDVTACANLDHAVEDVGAMYVKH